MFVALATLFGLALSIVSPPLDPADERRHLHRVFAMSEGHLGPIGDEVGHTHQIPESFNDLHPPYRFATADGRIHDERVPGGKIVCLHDPAAVAATLSIPLAPQARTDGRTPLPYGPVSYVPQAIVVFVARHLGGSAGVLLYLSRLATLACFVSLGWLALRTAPVHKWSLLVLLLGPMSLHQGSVLSADAVTTGLSLLLVSGVVGLAVAPRLLRGPQLAVVICVCAALSLSKQGYWGLGLLLLLVPASCFGTRIRRFGLIAGAALVMGVLAWGWLVALDAADSGPATAEEFADIVAGLSHFPSAALVLVPLWQAISIQFVGLLGHLDVVLPRWIYTAYPVALLAIALCDSPDAPRLTWRLRAGLIGVAGGALLVLLLVLFIVAPHQGKGSLAAMIQGRHLIPLAPLLLLALPAPLALPRFWGPLAISAFCTLVLGCSVWAVGHHYFVGTLPAG